MKIEHLTAPPPESPRTRYASLQRAIERGMASDRTWMELAEVCVELGREDEALSCLHQVESARERGHLERRLITRGVKVPRARTRPSTARHAAVRPARADDDLTTPTVGEEVADVLRFLADGPMARTLILATATFPLTVALAGHLIRTTSSPALPSLALLPAVLLTMLVVAMARATIIDSAKGHDDAPGIPGFGFILRDVWRFGFDLSLLTVLFLGPWIAGLQHGMPLYGAAAGVAAGLMLLPIAFLLRTVCRDWRALGPITLVKAIVGGGRAYAGRLVATLLILAPAATCWWATAQSPLFLRVALVGPLVLAPLLVSARLLGRLAHLHRERLPIGSREAAGGARPTAKAAKRRPARRAARKGPAQRSGAEASTARRSYASARPSSTRLKPVFERTAAAAVEQPARRPGSAVRPGSGVRPRGVIGEEIPDLTSMPGVSLVKGEDRQNAGAAAGSKSQISFG